MNLKAILSISNEQEVDVFQAIGTSWLITDPKFEGKG
jgi:hypothetical protein